MKYAIESKFKNHGNFLNPLMATGNREIVERTKNDTCWGVSLEGIGDNMMGKLLMDLRATLCGKEGV